MGVRLACGPVAAAVRRCALRASKIRIGSSTSTKPPGAGRHRRGCRSDDLVIKTSARQQPRRGPRRRRRRTGTSTACPGGRRRLPPRRRQEKQQESRTTSGGPGATIRRPRARRGPRRASRRLRWPAGASPASVIVARRGSTPSTAEAATAPAIKHLSTFQASAAPRTLRAACSPNNSALPRSSTNTRSARAFVERLDASRRHAQCTPCSSRRRLISMADRARLGESADSQRRGIPAWPGSRRIWDFEIADHQDLKPA